MDLPSTGGMVRAGPGPWLAAGRNRVRSAREQHRHEPKPRWTAARIPADGFIVFHGPNVRERVNLGRGVHLPTYSPGLGGVTTNVTGMAATVSMAWLYGVEAMTVRLPP